VANPVVLIQDGKIASVGSNLTIPTGYQVVDLGSATILPGLIDCHTHLLHYYDDTYTNDLAELSEKSTALRALMGSVLARGMLKAGFTTVRDLGNSGFNGDVALRNAINLGYVVGPRMLVSTRALSPVGGQFGRLTPGALSLVREEYVEIVGVEEARKAVRQAIYYGANCIKVIANAMNQYMSTEELKAIVDEAHRVGIKVAAHATGGKSIMNCIDAGVDSIEHGYTLSDEELKKMAAKQIFLVPTDEPNIPDQQKRLARALKAGVPIAAGADWYTSRQPGGKEDKTENPLLLRGESSKIIFKAYVQSGMTPVQAIQTGTLNAGRLLSYYDMYGNGITPGVIEEGRPADIIAVKGEILDEIGVLDKVGFVMKEGKIFFDTYSNLPK
jgi:imidazolonepropionase-like amidohydrolase